MLDGDIAKKTLAQQVADKMRLEIVTNVLPSGSRITIQEIALRYNTSPLPVREAFNMLSGENLVEMIPYKGAIIRSIDRLFFENIFDIMTALEVLSINSAICNWTPELKAELVSINEKIYAFKNDKQVQAQYTEYNMAFHHLIERYYQNDQAAELLGHYRELVLLVADKKSDNLHRAHQAAVEHDRLIEALEAGNISQARTVFLEHAYNARDHSLRLLY